MPVRLVIRDFSVHCLQTDIFQTIWVLKNQSAFCVSKQFVGLESMNIEEVNCKACANSSEVSSFTVVVE